MKKIWTPNNYKASNLFQFESFLSKNYNLNFLDYSEMHSWSINNLEEFWLSISEFFKIEFSKPYKYILKKDIPFYKTKWFNEAELSYVNHLLRYAKNNETAIIYQNEHSDVIDISWNSLLEKANEVRMV